MVDIVLKCCRGITEPKRGDQHLVKAKPGNKSCLPFMTLGDTDAVKRSDDVDLSVSFGAAKGVQGLLD